jgi:transformation/transcription domain-associated protein
MYQVHLYRGFLAICHPEDPHLSVVERYVELASGLCMREWRRLPHIVSHIHLPLLQAAQQVSLMYHMIPTWATGAGSVRQKVIK